MDSPVDRPGVRLPAAKAAVAPISPPPIPPLPASIGVENPLDRVAHAAIARLAGGISPMAIAEAAFDWALHLSVSPGRQSALALSALAKQATLAEAALRPLRAGCDGYATQRGRPEDRRFDAEESRR